MRPFEIRNQISFCLLKYTYEHIIHICNYYYCCCWSENSESCGEYPLGNIHSRILYTGATLQFNELNVLLYMHKVFLNKLHLLFVYRFVIITINIEKRAQTHLLRNILHISKIDLKLC